ncbi:MAG: HAMP domain-containing protein [Methylacidiphilales bacterium]|nr:HAMP domain-containing protein [Candidatus Methylacidiphilales bacterium]
MANLRLTEKITLLVLGIALFVGVAIASVGDWTLRRVGTDLKQARLNHINTAQISDADSVTPVVRADGRVVGILVVRGGASSEPTIINASHTAPAPKDVVFISASSMTAADDAVVPIEQMRSTLISTTAIVMLLAGVIGLVVARSVTAPFARLTADMKRLAKGDTNLKFTDASRQDEVGEMSRALEKVRDSIVEAGRSKQSYSQSPGLGLGEMFSGLRLDTATLNSALDSLSATAFDVGRGIIRILEIVTNEIASVGREIGKMDLGRSIQGVIMGRPART